MMMCCMIYFESSTNSLYNISIWLTHMLLFSASQHLSTHTPTGLVPTRTMYNLTARVLLRFRIWWWCMEGIKCKCGASESTLLFCSHSPAGLPRCYVNEANQRPASNFTAAITNLSNLIWGIRDEGSSAARTSIKKHQASMCFVFFHTPYINV